jgi:hypothetical protein
MFNNNQKCEKIKLLLDFFEKRRRPKNTVKKLFLPKSL